MKRVLLAIAVVVIAMGAVIYFTPSSRHHDFNASRLLAAAKSYADDLKTQGLPVPPSVSLHDLVAKKLLSDSDVTGFAGMEVTVSLAVDESRPQEVLMRARMPDGQEIVALADGSVQHLRK